MLRKLARVVALATAIIACTVSAQTVGTDAYPFSSFDNLGFDSINLGDLNTRFGIPIVQKTGRGLPFNYVVQYEGLIWTPVASGASSVWTPSPTWGFNGQLNGTGLSGYLTFNTISTKCSGIQVFSQTLTAFVYHDPFGANHSFGYRTSSGCPGGNPGPSSSGSLQASDGSGYSLLPGGGQVQTRNGVIITPPTSSTGQSASSEVDSNGNEINFGGTNGIFTDTTGKTALTISGSSPITLTYPVVNQSGGGATASATLYYKTYTVQTNFGCSGIVEYGSTLVNLVDHIVLADGSEYAFTYESTPGTSGSVTGRLASITLPTGEKSLTPIVVDAALLGELWLTERLPLFLGPQLTVQMLELTSERPLIQP